MREMILHGDCLVNRAAELHQLFLHLLAGTDKQVEIDMSATGRCDVSFFQLICAACRSYSQHDKRIVLRNALPLSVADQFRKTGLDRACSACAHTECIFREALRDEKERHPQIVPVQNQR